MRLASFWRRRRDFARAKSPAPLPAWEPLESRHLLSAFIGTDLPDYQFGSTVQIAGGGFAPQEAVQIQVLHAEGTPGSNEDVQNQPWQVIADGEGNVSAIWDVTDPDAPGATYVLSALGLTSGELATATFTDGKDVWGVTVLEATYAGNTLTVTFSYNTAGNVTVVDGFVHVLDVTDGFVEQTPLTSGAGQIGTISLTFAEPLAEGEYRLQVKVDVTRVKPGGGTDSSSDVSSPPHRFTSTGQGDPKFDITGQKFYDLNTDGIKDLDELGVAGWRIWLDVDGNGLFETGLDLETLTDENGCYCFLELNVGTYTVYEDLTSLAGWWVNTTAASVQVALADNVTVDFGNVKLGAGGGHTIGYWTNKNGEAQLKDEGGAASELALLTDYNLAKNDLEGKTIVGASDFDPASYDALKKWLQNATAVNMSYMLSAQMAAMILNVEAGKDSGFVDGNSLVYAKQLLDVAPGTAGLNAAGFITVNDLISAADASLALDNYTPDGDVLRAIQEALKNALDLANNNKTFVLSSW